MQQSRQPNSLTNIQALLDSFRNPLACNPYVSNIQFSTTGWLQLCKSTCQIQVHSRLHFVHYCAWLIILAFVCLWRLLVSSPLLTSSIPFFCLLGTSLTLQPAGAGDKGWDMLSRRGCSVPVCMWPMSDTLCACDRAKSPESKYLRRSERVESVYACTGEHNREIPRVGD